MSKKSFCFLIFSLVVLLSCKEKKNKTLETPEVGVEKMDNSPTTHQYKKITSKEDIQTHFSKINNRLKSHDLDSSYFQYDCYGEKKGTLSFYSEGDSLKMIKHQYVEHDHFSAIDRYYINSGKPFFILSEETIWNFVAPRETKDSIFESRYYIIDNEVTECLQKNYSIVSAEKEKSKSETIPNKEIACPPVQDLLKEFQLLIANRHQKGKIECLK